MNAHTKGPWHVAPGEDNEDSHPGADSIVYGAIKGDDYHIARVWNDVGVGVAEANARLIAAAPELLEALQNLAAYANGRLGKNPYLIPEYKQALIAIASALGKSTDGNAWMDANAEADAAENKKREGQS